MAVASIAEGTRQAMEPKLAQIVSYVLSIAHRNPLTCF
jgi:hypothetical protein